MVVGSVRPVRALVAALVLAGSLVAGPARAGSAPPPNRPNILILVSDDQVRLNFTRDLMPNVFSQLVDKGVTFDNGYDVTGLCCPSRSEIMTGLYEHHTGVDDNATVLSRPKIVDALHDLGYHTSLTGKYLNSADCDPQPNWDQWVCMGRGQSNDSLEDPILNVDGKWMRFQGYTTDILADYLVDFVDSTPTDQPFFAMYTPTSPHVPANDPRCYDTPVSPYRPPSFDEDTQGANKPAYIQRPALGPTEIQNDDQDFKRMNRTIPCLDGSIGTILNGLGTREANTLVFYLSDNGFLYGEHRRWDKAAPYDEVHHVPFVVRYPPLRPEDQPIQSSAIVENVDIVPTIADLLGIHWGADGLAMTSLLSGQSTSIRSAGLIEGCQGFHYPCLPGVIQLGQPDTPSFNGVVDGRYTYVEYLTGEKELYDLSTDPYQLQNLDGDPSYEQVESDLAADLVELRAPPVTDTTIVSGPQGTLADRYGEFTFFSQSRLASYQCRLDTDGVPGPWQWCDAGSTTVGPLPDGVYTFEVQAVDENGVVDPTPDTRSFSVATTGPGVSITSGPATHLKDNVVSFQFSSLAPAATWQCRNSLVGLQPLWKPCSTGQTYSDLADGQYAFEVRAQDGHGNKTTPRRPGSTGSTMRDRPSPSRTSRHRPR